MGIRVKIDVQSVLSPWRLELSAPLNSGFETESPEILVPTRVAEILGFLPQLPQGTLIKAYETAGGIVKMYSLKDAVKVQVVTEDRKSALITCTIVISEIEREAILSDITIGRLGIVLESLDVGHWRFKGEERIRLSTQPQYW